MSLRRSFFISTSLVAILAVSEVCIDAAPVPPVRVLPWNINNGSKLVIRPVWIMVPKDEVVVLFTDAVTSAAPSKASTATTKVPGTSRKAITKPRTVRRSTAKPYEPTETTKAPVTSRKTTTKPTTVRHSTAEPYEPTETTEDAPETTTDGATTESPAVTDSSTVQATTGEPEPRDTTSMEPSNSTDSIANKTPSKATEKPKTVSAPMSSSSEASEVTSTTVGSETSSDTEQPDAPIPTYIDNVMGDTGRTDDPGETVPPAPDYDTDMFDELLTTTDADPDPY